VIGDPMFVYVAAYAGNLAADNALNGKKRRYDLSAVPSVTFTDPAVASVGLTETAAREGGIDAIVARLGLEHVPRARAARDTRGFTQLVADAGTQRIIGAQVIASEAGELIAEAALAVRLGPLIKSRAPSTRISRLRKDSSLRLRLSQQTSRNYPAALHKAHDTWQTLDRSFGAKRIFLGWPRFTGR
jgi:mercuric reductase